MNENKIKAARLAAGLTQQQLAEKVGCYQKDISRWEQGRNPNIVTLKKIALATGTTIENLIED